jgi:hypothetical protein
MAKRALTSSGGGTVLPARTPDGKRFSVTCGALKTIPHQYVGSRVE